MKTYLSLGSNLGDKRGNILRAIEIMKEQIGTLVSQSALYETEPWGFRSDNGFVNAAVCFETELQPHDLLHVTQAIERQMGRTHKSVPTGKADVLPEYHDRIIDIDILLYGDERVNTHELTIPHPLMRVREFVMTPLMEIY